MQVISMIECWDFRDVYKEINNLQINDKIAVYLDKNAKNIKSFTNLSSEFINTGFFIVDKDLKVHYILLTSYDYPFTLERIENFVKTVESFLDKE